MPTTISVKGRFAAGHRILNLEGPGAKCRNIHGHNFAVTWRFLADDVLEFGALKGVLRSLVKGHFDHGFILDKADDFCYYLDANMLRSYKLDGPPTTEAIAAEIARLSIDALTLPPPKRYANDNEGEARYPNAKLISVDLEEGPENSATWVNPQATGWTSQSTLLSGLTSLAGLGIKGPING